MTNPDTPRTPDDTHFEAVDRFLRGGVNLLAAGQEQRIGIRERSKIVYGGLLDAHLVLMGTLARAVERMHLRPGATSDSISERLTLYASFIQGIDITETAVTEGLYAQASALLKQEMETVAAMNELVSGARRDGRTPNVRHLMWQMGVHYGRINDLVHVGRRSMLHDFYQAEAVGEAVPVSVTPRFSELASKYLFTLHVGVLCQFVIAVGELLQDLYGESWSLEEQRFVLQAVDLLEREGAFE